MRSVLRQKFFLFLRFFCGTHFCEGPGVPWTLGLQSNPTQAYKCGSVELWDCSPWTMDPSCTELAPLSALGHSNIKMQVSGSARTSPFICFGAHQCPNSNMSNVLTQYLTLVGTLLHNTFSDSTARSIMGSEKQKAGGVGQQAVGQTQHRPAIVVFLQRGAGAKKKNCDFFCGTHFCEGHKAKN